VPVADLVCDLPVTTTTGVGYSPALVGHKTDLMYSRYNITSTDDVREAIEAVSKRD